MLCNRCSDFFYRDWQTRDEWSDTHQISLSSQTIELTCNLCSQLQSRFLVKPSTEYTVHPNGGGSGTCLLKIALVHDVDMELDSYYLEFQELIYQKSRQSFKLLLLPVNDHESRRSMEEQPFDTTNSTTSYDCAMKWVRDCLQNHEGCKSYPHTRSTYLPRRLVFTGVSANIIEPRLCESATLPEGVMYMTLSHCWGDASVFRLLQSNYDSCLEGIPISKLPRVFHDALYVAARAGIRYLWIDSLCIIQDSVEDWTSESVEMGKIYSGGICNIAATGFKDGSIGLFMERDHKLIAPIQHVFHKPIMMNGKVGVKSGMYQLADYNVWNVGVEDAPLNQRAWVVQERFLSPRTLHFGFRQLFWECRQKLACEMIPQGFTGQFPIWGAKRGKLDALHEGDANSRDAGQLATPLRPDSSSVDMNQYHKEFTYETWRDIVSRYSGSHLTVSSDRLIAIAGLAKLMGARLKGRYLAGLWEHGLLHQLLWYVSGDKSSFIGPVEYRGPSWSWVSVDGHVNIPDYTAPDLDSIDKDSLILARVLDAEVNLCGPDNFGPISHGRIRIRAFVGILFIVHNFLRKTSGAHIDKEVIAKLPTSSIRVTCYEDVGEPSFGMKLELLHTVVRRTGVDLDDPSVLFYLPIRKEPKDEYLPDLELRGLLLRPTMIRRGEFRRVGIFVCDDENWIKLLQTSTGNLPQRFYTDWNKELSQYTISIV